MERPEQVISGHPDNTIVAVYKGNLVGVAETEFSKKCPVNDLMARELSKRYILEWFCRQGIGCHLLAETEKVMLPKGSRKYGTGCSNQTTALFPFMKNSTSNG